MASREDLSKSYRRMTDATEATRRAVDRVDDSVRANTRATQLGNVIAGVAALRAEVNAKKARERIDAVGGNIDDMNAAVTEKLDQLSGGIQSLTGEVSKTNEQLEHLKSINFAQWRDGVGQTYWYEYRPLGRKLLADYDELSLAWRHLVAHRVTEVIDRYPEWKDEEWLLDSIRDGQYYPYPKFPSGPRQVAPLPDGLWKKDRKRLGEFPNIIIAFILFVLAFMVTFGAFLGADDDRREEQRSEMVQSYRNDENSALYPMMQYWPDGYSCREDRLIERVENLRDEAPEGSDERKSWDRALEAGTGAVNEACDRRIELRNENYYGMGEDPSVEGLDMSIGMMQFLSFLMGLACVIGFRLYLGSENKKIVAHNQRINDVVDGHRAAVLRARSEWESKCDSISSEWAKRNIDAGCEMERRFTELVGVPLSGKGASEFWAAPTTKREAHEWAELLKRDRVDPPSKDDYFEPSRIQVNPRMPGWYRERFESSYRAVVPHEL